MLLLTGLVLVLNVTTVLRVDEVSRIDEQYWIDHLLRGADFAIERTGAPILQETVREKCARGVQFDPFVPSCEKGHLNPRKYGYWHGVNITGHTPFYFFVTGPIARVLRATPIDLPPNDSLVTWARLLGSAWLLAGLYCIVRIGEILRVHRRMLIVACVLAAATPALLHADTIVSPDATAVVSGAAVLLAALSWERRGKGLAWLALAAVLGAAFSAKNGIGVVLVLVYFAYRLLAGALRQSDDDDIRPWQSYAKAGAILVVALYLAGNGWDDFYAWIQNNVFTSAGPIADITGNPIETSYGNRDAGFWQYFGLGTVFMMLPPFNDVAFPPERTHVLYQTVAKAAEYVAIGVLFAVPLRDKLTSKTAVLAYATLTTLLIAPTLTVLRNQVFSGTFDQPIWRYGLAAMPGVVIVIACAARNRFAQVALTTLTGVLYVSALYVVFRSPLA